uniref:ribonuclease Z n=1 Tax=Meloidogyne enterolobii TaxID=390850 RepID=A0A6V7WKV4_MELEN|nr:unnamed protein product [Meloidogyne enterolobii]CAD2206719.1 unnamed protein product [Meloidogyne enterolobii]
MNTLNSFLKVINLIVLRRNKFTMESKRSKILHEIAPSNITLEILSNGSSHMTPSVFIRTPHRCYLFNCPEGMSRLSTFLRVRPTHVEDIFITKGKWENVVGIPGLVLNKGSEDDVRIHGPPIAIDILKSFSPMLDADFGSTNNFIKMRHCDVKRDNYEDSTLFINYLNVENSKERRYLKNGDNTPTNTAFLIKLKPCLPALDPLKLIELKIPRSPLISKLKSGETITLQDGRIIKPEDVIDFRKKSESLSLLVADICSSQNLQSISSNYLLKDFMGDKRIQKLNYIIHFTQQKIFETKEYKNWMGEFGTDCQHLILNVKGRFLPLSDNVYNSHYMLRSIFSDGFPEIYPIGQVLEGEVILQDDDKYDIKIDNEDNNIGPVFIPEFLRRFSLRGTLDKNEMNPILLDFNWQRFLNDRLKKEPVELQKRIDEFKQVYTKTFDNFGNRPRDVYPTVVFLGTSSACPTKYRNVCSQLVRLSEFSNILIDCGEATYGQLLALFGPSNIDQFLTKLNAIFITHAHLDHILGVFHIISRRIEAFEKQEIPYVPLVVCHDVSFLHLCNTYSEIFLDLFPFIISICLPTFFYANSSAQGIRQHISAVDLIKHFPKNIFCHDDWNLSEATAFQVEHTKWSCGYSFVTLKEKRKIVFSGDTKPCENIIKYGKDADLLIHECTFEDGLEEDASYKKHSTMKQAFDASVKIGAKNVFFTHFSARYHLTPPLPDYILNAGNISMANDLMSVPFDLLPLFPKLLPIYQYLYKDELFEFEMRKMTRMANNNARLNEKYNTGSFEEILKQKRKANS